MLSVEKYDGKRSGKKKIRKNQNKTNTLNTFFRLLTCLSTNIILMAEMWTRFPLIRSGPYLIVDTARRQCARVDETEGGEKKGSPIDTLTQTTWYGY
jgi:hypothetical protein